MQHSDRFVARPAQSSARSATPASCEPRRCFLVQEMNVARFEHQRLTAGVHDGLRHCFENTNTYVAFFRMRRLAHKGLWLGSSTGSSSI